MVRLLKTCNILGPGPFSSRQFYGKINQLQYGFASAGDLTYFSFGNTGFAGAYSLLDRVASARVHLAEKNQEMNQAQKEQYRIELIHLMLANIDLNIQRDEQILKAATIKINVGAGIRLDQLRAKNLLEYEKIRKMDIVDQIQRAKADLVLTIGFDQNNFEVEPLQFQALPSNNIFNSNAKPEAYFKDRKDLVTSQKSV